MDALTSVRHGLEGEVAALDVEGEVVNVQSAGADQHLVVLDLNIPVIIDFEIRTRRSFVLLGPVSNTRKNTHGGDFHRTRLQNYRNSDNQIPVLYSVFPK